MSDARAGLRRLSQKQTELSHAASRAPDSAIEPPPGLNPADVTPIADADRAKAELTLRQAIDVIAAAPPQEPTAAPPDRLALDTAVRLYASGRLAMMDGNLPQAINDLQGATRLDPAASEPWECLAQALARAGQLRAADEALMKAVVAGSDDVETVLAASRLLLQRGRAADAAAALAKVGARQGASDAAVPAIVNAAIGPVLIDLGYTMAGAQAMREAADVPEPFMAPTVYREELADVYRRRSDLWRAVGDAACRMQQYPAAADAYARATSVQSLDPGASLARRVYACLRSGRSADAALALLDDLSGADARVEDRHVVLIRYIARHGPDSAPLLAKGIEGLRSARSSPGADSLNGRLARAAAAAVPAANPAEARSILLRRLESAPAEEETISALCETYPADQAGSAVSALSGIADRNPQEADRIGAALLRHAPSDRWSAIERYCLEQGTSGSGASLISAAVLARTNHPDEAVAHAMASLDRAAGRGGAGLLATAVGARLGRWDLVDRGLAEARAAAEAPGASRVARVTSSHALAMAQRFDAAASALPAEPPPESDRSWQAVNELQFRADLAGVRGELDNVESLLRRVIVSDPYIESIHLAVIRLYNEGGPLANQSKLLAAVRDIREQVPSSRGLRLMRAQDLTRSNQLALAEPELLALAEEDPFDRDTFQTLGSLWDRVASIGVGKEAILLRARQRMERLAGAAPASPWPIVAIATLDAVEGKAAVGITRLREAQAGAVGECAEAYAAATESMLRRDARMDEADAMTMRRLRSAPPNINATVALASALIRSGDLPQGGSVLKDRFPRDAQWTPDQGALLADAVAGALNDHPRESVALARSLAVNATASSAAPMFRLWFRTVAIGGSTDEAIEFVRVVHDRQIVRQFVSEAAQPGPDGKPGPATTADLAYQMALVMASRGGSGADDAAVPLYDLALSFDPSHAMTCNNLGYMLLEKGRDLDRAERLLETAHSALPDDANVTDSIGWLRYKRGVMDDQVDENGKVVREGAVSLLRRAVDQQGMRGDGTLQDHLGDALWARSAEGDRDEAVRVWRLAEQRAQGAIAAAASNRVNPAAVERANALIRAVRAKQQAVIRGREPRIAPRLVPSASGG